MITIRQKKRQQRIGYQMNLDKKVEIERHCERQIM